MGRLPRGSSVTGTEQELSFVNSLRIVTAGSPQCGRHPYARGVADPPPEPTEAEDLRAILQAEHQALLARITERRSRAEKLSALAAEAQRQADADERLLRELEAMLGLAPQLRIDALDPRLRGKRLQEVAVDLLRAKIGPGTPVHYKDWFALLRQEGHVVAGRDPVATFLAQVSRAPKVERIGNRSGLYRLREPA